MKADNGRGHREGLAPEAVGLAVEGIESASFLTEEQTRDIFSDNAVSVFRQDRK